MGHAERFSAPYASQAPHSRCLDSPHCGLPASVARTFGGLDGLWLHYGPIAPATTPLTVHRADRAAIDQNSSRFLAQTCRDWRPYEGCHLDLFCLERRPGSGAARHHPAVAIGRIVVWRVYSIAWREEGGPSVIWKAPGFGLRGEGWTQVSPERQTATTSAELSRLEDLLEGRRSPRPGRPPRWRDPSWRDATERAIARKRAAPGIPWTSIAEAVGMSLSALREYRRLLGREQEHGHELQLLEGGDLE